MESNVLLEDAYDTGAGRHAKLCAPSCGMKPILWLCSRLPKRAVLVQKEKATGQGYGFCKEVTGSDDWH